MLRICAEVEDPVVDLHLVDVSTVPKMSSKLNARKPKVDNSGTHLATTTSMEPPQAKMENKFYLIMGGFLFTQFDYII